MVKRNFITKLHNSTKRNYLERMNDNKIHCMQIAKKYEKEYWDGDRRYGYGGYKYIPGRWRSVAKKLIKTYKLKAGSKILDVAQDLLNISFEGLERRNFKDKNGISETQYLDPLLNILENGQTPADDLLKKFNGAWKKDIYKIFTISN